MVEKLLDARGFSGVRCARWRATRGWQFLSAILAGTGWAAVVRKRERGSSDRPGAPGRKFAIAAGADRAGARQSDVLPTAAGLAPPPKHPRLADRLHRTERRGSAQDSLPLS